MNNKKCSNTNNLKGPSSKQAKTTDINQQVQSAILNVLRQTNNFPANRGRGHGRRYRHSRGRGGQF